MIDTDIFAKEYWTGDSRDGALVNGDGYHFFRMQNRSLIVEAYEMYESDEGEEIVTPLPEMHNVNWLKDLGFEDLEALDQIEEWEFKRIKSLLDETHQS